MKKIYIPLAFLLLVSCSNSQEVNTSVFTPASSSSSSILSDANTEKNADTIICNQKMSSGEISKLEKMLSQILESNIYSIGGNCTLQDGSQWISVQTFEKEEFDIESLLVLLDSNKKLIKKLKGYGTFSGDHKACALGKMINQRLIVECNSGFGTNIVSVNTNTDERIELSDGTFGEGRYAAMMNDSPFQNFSYSGALVTNKCKMPDETQEWTNVLSEALKKTILEVGDVCDVSPHGIIGSYLYEKLNQPGGGKINGIAIINRDKNKVVYAENFSYPKPYLELGVPTFSYQSGSAFIFTFEYGNSKTEEEHWGFFVADPVLQKADLIDASHIQRTLNPCDSEGCFSYPI